MDARILDNLARVGDCLVECASLSNVLLVLLTPLGRLISAPLAPQRLARTSRRQSLVQPKAKPVKRSRVRHFRKDEVWALYRTKWIVQTKGFFMIPGKSKQKTTE